MEFATTSTPEEAKTREVETLPTLEIERPLLCVNELFTEALSQYGDRQVEYSQVSSEDEDTPYGRAAAQAMAQAFETVTMVCEAHTAHCVALALRQAAEAKTD